MTNADVYYCFTCDKLRTYHEHPERVSIRREDGSYIFPAMKSVI